MDIECYNYLTDYNSDERTYPMKPTDLGINAYYGRNDGVILVGGEDLWYIYWLSVTKVYDEERNRQIVDYVLQMQPTVFGHRYIVLQSTKYTTEQLRTFYTAPKSSYQIFITRTYIEKLNSFYTTSISILKNKNNPLTKYYLKK